MADVLTSALLSEHGFSHGFSLRTGGVSRGPFESLNLGRTLGDAPEAVEENHRRFARAVGYPEGGLFEVSQVHGTAVRFVAPGEAPEAVRKEEADALVAATAGIVVGVRVADCVPILLADAHCGAVAAVHAGWRGAVAGVLPAAIQVLLGRTGSSASALIAAIGPHIRKSSFEIGEEVAEAMEAAAPGATVVDRRRYPRPHGDLLALVCFQLRAAGLSEDRVDVVGGNTHADPARFFSHRRDAGHTGRHVAAIVAR